MKSSNLVLMTVAIVAVGIIAMPSTISLFAGQHTWYNISGDNDLPCRKCHADVFAELEQSAFHKWSSSLQAGQGTGTPDNTACYGCHRANASIQYANVGTSVTDVKAGNKSHAASTVACMLCHQFNASVHVLTMSGYEAGGFAQPTGSPYTYNNTTHPGGHAAHQGFIQSAIDDTTMEDANEACIACHTHIPVKINWTHRYSLEFSCVPEFEKLPPTHFNVTDWTLNGTYNITVYGWRDGTGNTSKEGWPGGYP